MLKHETKLARSHRALHQGAAKYIRMLMSEHETFLTKSLQVLHQRLTNYVKTKKISPQTSQVLDATRAIAAGLVVLFHARINTFGSVQSPFYELLYAPTNCGTPAVFWFFIISGYLVGGAVIAEVAQSGSFDFRRYLLSRMTRLYIVLIPALAFGAVLDSARIATWGADVHAGFETASSLSATSLIGNIFFLQTIVVNPSGSNWPLWSLAWEFWYYITFPLLIAPLMIKKSLLQRMILFLLGAIVVLLIAKRNISLPWLYTLWLLGAAIRYIRIRPFKSTALAWSVAAAVLLTYPYLYPRIGMVATQLVGITFAIALLETHGQTSKIAPSWATLAQGLSGFSFSLYVVHAPLIHYMTTNIGQSSDPRLRLSPSSLIGLGVFVALVATSYIIAFLFSLTTERYTEDLRRLLLPIGTPARPPPS
jgi:peptidoglycan/LPS O-acetylase OafA/YrhL